ncbi:MAG: hypothetical protein MZV64_15845 [Ignavibacteriales bacterium]|nr:hypothetical protein [Ignavibacteriales bacterium]
MRVGLGVVELDRIADPADEIPSTIFKSVDRGIAFADAFVVGHVVAGDQLRFRQRR